MDGLFELLIILLIVLFPVLETMAKRRRRRRSEEEGEPEPPGAPAPTGSRGEPRGRAERTSEVLLPEDLWEELTGERRRPGSGTAGAGSRTGTSGDVATAEERPLEAAGEPGGPWEERVEPEVEPGAADVPEPEGVIGRTEVGAPGRRAAGEPPPPGEPADVEGPDRAALLREVGRGEGGLRRRRASELARVRPGRLGRRGATSAGAREPHPLLGELDREALRRAILYREILGPPKGLD